MPRKASAVLQYKLRIREALRRLIEQAAKKRGVSANYEMVKRLEESFDRDDKLTLHGLAQDMSNTWARYGELFHSLNKQGDLLRATEALVAKIEAMPESAQAPLADAVATVRAVTAMIDAEALRLPRMMHATGEVP